jgi:hypothetical protein
MNKKIRIKVVYTIKKLDLHTINSLNYSYFQSARSAILRIKTNSFYTRMGQKSMFQYCTN